MNRLEVLCISVNIPSYIEHSATRGLLVRLHSDRTIISIECCEYTLLVLRKDLIYFPFSVISTALVSCARTAYDDHQQ